MGQLWRDYCFRKAGATFYILVLRIFATQRRNYLVEITLGTIYIMYIHIHGKYDV